MKQACSAVLCIIYNPVMKGYWQILSLLLLLSWNVPILCLDIYWPYTVAVWHVIPIRCASCAIGPLSKVVLQCCSATQRVCSCPSKAIDADHAEHILASAAAAAKFERKEGYTCHSDGTSATVFAGAGDLWGVMPNPLICKVSNAENI